MEQHKLVEDIVAVLEGEGHCRCRWHGNTVLAGVLLAGPGAGQRGWSVQRAGEVQADDRCGELVSPPPGRLSDPLLRGQPAGPASPTSWQAG